METENEQLKNRIAELEAENEKIKKNLESYTLKNKKYYEENKEIHKQRVKEYKEKTNYYQNLSADKKKEYARTAYLNKKEKNTCQHNKIIQLCRICDGSELCISGFCDTMKNPNYEGHCLRCFINLHPDKPNARNYKTKERTVVDIVLAAFPSFTWVTDKKVIGGCSRRRPDLFLDMGSHVIIVEVDENQHTEYDCSCENKRLMEISQDVGHRPIIFIRFNPDDYTDQSGTKVKSCFAADKSGIFKVAKSKVADWNMRTNALLQQIAYWSETPTTKTVEVVQLFYDS